jgi:cell division protein FtsB
VNRAFDALRKLASHAHLNLLSLGWPLALPSRHRLLAGIAIGLTVWMTRCAVYAPNGLLAYQQKRAEYQQLLQKNQQMEKENEDLARRIKALKTDPRAIESIAREGLGLVRPGEYVIRLDSGKMTTRTSPQAPASLGQKSSANTSRQPDPPSTPVR